MHSKILSKTFENDLQFSFMWTAAETYLSESPVSAAPAVTGFSDKTGSLSEKKRNL
jgi:hypothetical protein